MQVLKYKKRISEYILLVVLSPIVSLILKEIIETLFQIGKYYGTFFRALFELVLRNL